MYLGVAQGHRIYFPKEWELVLVLRRGVVEHFTRFFIVGDFIRKHTVVNEPSAPYRLSEKHPLFGVGHSPELVRFVHKITNFYRISQINYTTKGGETQWIGAIPLPPIEVGESLLSYVERVPGEA